MIQLKINHMSHGAKLTVPAEYERVVLALWSIGLDHDPEKYTLRRLGAEFTSTTEEESRMIQLIDPGNTLMQAMCLLNEMMYRDVRQAAAFLMRIRNSYSSSGRSFACQPFDIHSLFDQILDMSARLANVIIEQQSFEVLIPHYDREESFF